MRVLVISPYKGLKESIISIARSYPELEIETVGGNLDDAIVQINKLGFLQYDAIISRGETAKLLSKKVSIPVINIGISVYDFARAIKLSVAFEGKAAIVGFPYITKAAETLVSEFQQKIDIVTCNERKDIHEILDTLKVKGYKTVIGDVFACQHADERNFNSILLTSGKESIVRALEETIFVCRSIEESQKKISILKNIINNQNEKCLILDKSGNVVFSSNAKPFLSADDISHLNELFNEDTSVLAQYENRLYRVKASVSEEFRSFSFADINFLSDTSDYLYESNEPNSELLAVCKAAMRKNLPEMKQLIDNKKPVIIIGYPGNDNDYFAYSAHSAGSFNSKPLLTLDCSALDVKRCKTFTELINNTFSKHAEICLHIKNPELIPKSEVHVLNTLKNLVQNTSADVVITCNGNISKISKINLNVADFLNTYKDCVFTMSPLNDDSSCISDIVPACINEANQACGNQITTIDSSAMKAIESFDWTENIEQLYSVIYDAVSSSNKPSLDYKEVLQAFDRYKSISAAMSSQMDLSKTLEEAEDHYISLVLEEENYNYSKAATRLGIGRSTLWRKVNQIRSTK